MWDMNNTATLSAMLDGIELTDAQQLPNAHEAARALEIARHQVSVMESCGRITGALQCLDYTPNVEEWEREHPGPMSYTWTPRSVQYAGWPTTNQWDLKVYTDTSETDVLIIRDLLVRANVIEGYDGGLEDMEEAYTAVGNIRVQETPVQ